MGVRISPDEPEPTGINRIIRESHRSARRTQHEASNIVGAKLKVQMQTIVWKIKHHKSQEALEECKLYYANTESKEQTTHIY